MREIKFRAYDKQLGVFIATGFHVIGEVTMFNMIDQYCFENKGKTTTIDRYGDVEIMQYTGLKDKNGKEIYEGDIVALDKMILPITWQDGAFQMIGDKNQGRSPANRERLRKFEVIGNIYENPDLL